ncbi:uncharacterized protein LOC127845568 [Dreissena polymorpha]|uniref:CUB domain-containing protein n=1 Tax=Dreissena polymorpha TaxID=45954 RepID=A0A9D4DYB5_DREPO|nr:uncharacterized protein LOC127845568 [Dreissena polymorpha]KAH3768705.1 hypothetical protein DPMN_169922 [Dreissena polymorpha]
MANAASSMHTGCLFGVAVIFIQCFVVAAFDQYRLSDVCSQRISTFGGELSFDSDLAPGGQPCEVELVGVGPTDTMWSLYFQTFEVSGVQGTGCRANVTIKEPGAGPVIFGVKTGLYATFCSHDNRLDGNTMFTTLGNRIQVVFTPVSPGRQGTYRQYDQPDTSRIVFQMKLSTFVIRRTGCSSQEVDTGMMTCKSGRCVHESLVCHDLNPCGDFGDCGDSSGEPSNLAGKEERSGASFLTVTLIVVGVVFGLFALLQIALILRKKSSKNGWIHNKGGLVGEFIPQKSATNQTSPIEEEQVVFIET